MLEMLNFSSVASMGLYQALLAVGVAVSVIGIVFLSRSKDNSKHSN